MAVRWLVLHQVREFLKHLGQALTIPDGTLTIHGRADQEANLWPRTRNLANLREEVSDDGLHAQRHGRGGPGGGASEEIRHARQDAHVGLGLDGLQRRGEERQPAALDQLRPGHERAVPHVVLVHVTLDVRVTHDGDATNLRHDEGALKLF